MKQYKLYEDNRPVKLITYFSSEFEDKIDSIKTCNRYNEEGIKQLQDELKTILNHIANPSIAFCYSQEYRQNSNGTILVRIFGYEVIYNIITDNNVVSVCIVDITFNAEDFGLNNPYQLQERKRNKKVYRITETQLHTIVENVIKELLLTA